MALNVHVWPLRYLPHDFRRSLWSAANRWERGKFRRLRAGTDEGYGLGGYEKTNGLFVHIPKAAGVSICKALFGNLGGGHTAIRKYELIYSKARFDAFHKFTFVRNPWDRLFSAYTFLKSGGFGPDDAAWGAQHLADFPEFEPFVLTGLTRLSVRRKIHFVPQVNFLKGNDGRLKMDFIGRFERIGDDLATIADHLGVAGQLEHHNKTRRSTGSYRDHYSPAMVDAVASFYREDIEKLDYEF